MPSASGEAARPSDVPPKARGGQCEHRLFQGGRREARLHGPGVAALSAFGEGLLEVAVRAQIVLASSPSEAAAFQHLPRRPLEPAHLEPSAED